VQAVRTTLRSRPLIILLASLASAGCLREWVFNEAIESVSEHLAADAHVPVLQATPNPFGEGVIVVGGPCVDRVVAPEYIWLMFREDTFALDEASATATPALPAYKTAAPSILPLAGFTPAEIPKLKRSVQELLNACRS
jgi:hypothetical protein